MHGFSPQKLLGVESFGKFTHLSAVMEGKWLMNSAHGWEYSEKRVVMQRAKGGSEGSRGAVALSTVVHSLPVEEFPEVLSSRAVHKKIIQHRGS